MRNESSPIFKRIMVAMDHSDQAEFALDAATRLARKLQSELVLIHVVHVPLPTNPDMAYEHADVRAALLEGGQKFLELEAARVAGFAPETVLREGDAAHEIVDTATRLGVDLIVIGTHGRGRFASAVIGSVAQAVMRQATCPVLCLTHDLAGAGVGAHLDATREVARHSMPEAALT